MTNTSIQLYPSPSGTRQLPSITFCPLPAFRTKGNFYNMDVSLNNTYGIDDVFEEATVEQLMFNTSFYKHEEVYTILTGRCHMVSL